MQIFTVSSGDSGQSLIKYLMRLLSEAPSGLLYKQLRNKNITLNGKKATGNEKLKPQDEIKIFMADDTIDKFSNKAGVDVSVFEKAYKLLKGIKIVYEDEHVIVANKPVGILSQKSAPNDMSINEWLIGYLLDKGEITDRSLVNFKPSICNRLDRNTGGLILFGKTLLGTSFLSKAIKERTVHKYYTTIVTGKVIREESLSAYILKDENSNKVTVSKEPIEGGSYISTAYKPVRYSMKNDITELRVKLITGKAHQIRAHLSYIGHPVIGDNKYGNPVVNKRMNQICPLEGQFLYAVTLTFDENEEYPALSGKTISLDMKDKTDLFFEE